MRQKIIAQNPEEEIIDFDLYYFFEDGSEKLIKLRGTQDKVVHEYGHKINRYIMYGKDEFDELTDQQIDDLMNNEVRIDIS